jgi:hypothetical protein
MEAFIYSVKLFVHYLMTLSQHRIHTVSDDRMINELERIWKETLVAYSGYSTEILPNGLRKTKKTLSQGSQSPGRDSKSALPEYKSIALPLDQPVE